MNILFLTLLDFDSIDEHNIYTDLLQEFVKHGHKLFIISPVERRKQQDTRLITNKNVTILKLKIGNMQKINIIEKGISTISIEPTIICGIKKYFADIRFDLVLYSTPPITFYKAVEYVKNRDGSKTYLLLKDIFPQNAVDLGILSITGVKGILYRYFRSKEKKLYEISERIGCMSQANVTYILNHNPEVSSDKVEICPNSIEIIDKSVNEQERTNIRNKYQIPLDRTVFVYGGNLGKPQGIDFLIDCLKKQETNREVFFLIVGDGTEYSLLESYIKKNKPENVKIMKRLPKEDYDTLVGACDVGMIFLDHRFTIPNFPSRILSYMQAKLPVLAATDPNTDIGRIITEGEFGWWCESNDEKMFCTILEKCIESDLRIAGENGFEKLKQLYDAEEAYRIIIAECGMME